MPKVSERHKEMRRLEIVTAAEQVFIEQGFQHTTMTDIVLASGLSRGAVYGYYPNKDDMFKAILAEKDKVFAEYMEKLMQKTSMWEVLTAYSLEAISGLHEAKASFGTVIYEYLLTNWRDESRMEFFNERTKWATALFADLIKKGISRGEFTEKESPDLLARLFFMHQDSLYLQAMTLGANEQHLKEQTNLFLRMLEGVLRKT